MGNSLMILSSPSSMEAPSEAPSPLFFRILSKLIAGVASAYLLIFLLVALCRCLYPFELEWIEGACLDEMIWILDKKPLYGEPSAEFITLAYNPLYFYASAQLMKVMGTGFLAPRLISVLATLGTFALIFLLVYWESRRLLPGLVAAGLYAACFRFAGAWMDLAKTDSLFLFLILAGTVTGRRFPSPRGLILSGLFYVMAFYTKQVALPILLVLGVCSLVGSRGRTWPQWLTVTGVGLGIFLLLDVATHGWYSFYSLDIMTYHDFNSDRWLFWRKATGQMWPAMAVGLAYPVLSMRDHRAIKDVWMNASLVIATLLASWSIYLKVWTWDNDLMAACIGLSLLAGWGYGQIIRHSTQSGWGRKARLLHAGILLLLFCQFSFLFYNPFEQLPTQKDRTAARWLVERIHSLPGEVWVVNHGFLCHQAGKQQHFHTVPYRDVLAGKSPPPGTDTYRRRQTVASVFENAIQEQHFDWILVDRLTPACSPYYIPVEDLSQSCRFQPLTGAPTAPEMLLMKNPVAKGGSFPLTDSTCVCFFNSGWSAPEGEGRWALGTRSDLQIGLEKGHPYRIEFEASPHCSEHQVTTQEVAVKWNGQPVGEATLSSEGTQICVFDLPSALILDGPNSLSFEFTKARPDPSSPSILLTSLTFDQM